ncbi:hypothetical protein OSTOST_25288 [Ostertagia ostertagi]
MTTGKNGGSWRLTAGYEAITAVEVPSARATDLIDEGITRKRSSALKPWKRWKNPRNSRSRRRRLQKSEEIHARHAEARPVGEEVCESKIGGDGGTSEEFPEISSAEIAEARARIKSKQEEF